MSESDGEAECPLCMEPFELDDQRFYPCPCGYQICRFCWHRIRTEKDGLCPACRQVYADEPAEYHPVSAEQIRKMKEAEKQKRIEQRQKEIESRKSLVNIRVVQRNLVYAIGIPPRLADESILKKYEYFGKFGRIIKIVVNRQHPYGDPNDHTYSAYITYANNDSAAACVAMADETTMDDRVIRTYHGTTKYCNSFLRHQPCNNPDCMYLHELGNKADSFTKEEMNMGKHVADVTSHHIRRGVRGGTRVPQGEFPSLSGVPSRPPARKPAAKQARPPAAATPRAQAPQQQPQPQQQQPQQQQQVAAAGKAGPQGGVSQQRKASAQAAKPAAAKQLQPQPQQVQAPTQKAGKKQPAAAADKHKQQQPQTQHKASPPAPQGQTQPAAVGSKATAASSHASQGRQKQPQHMPSPQQRQQQAQQGQGAAQARSATASDAQNTAVKATEGAPPGGQVPAPTWEALPGADIWGSALEFAAGQHTAGRTAGGGGSMRPVGGDSVATPHELPTDEFEPITPTYAQLSSEFHFSMPPPEQVSDPWQTDTGPRTSAAQTGAVSTASSSLSWKQQMELLFPNSDPAITMVSPTAAPATPATTASTAQQHGPGTGPGGSWSMPGTTSSAPPVSLSQPMPSNNALQDLFPNLHINKQRQPAQQPQQQQQRLQRMPGPGPVPTSSPHKQPRAQGPPPPLQSTLPPLVAGPPGLFPAQQQPQQPQQPGGPPRAPASSTPGTRPGALHAPPGLEPAVHDTRQRGLPSNAHTNPTQRGSEVR